MTGRRQRYDLFAKRELRRWIVTRDVPHQRILEALDLMPGVDARQVFTECIASLGGDGWIPDGSIDHGFVFVERAGKRRLLTLTDRNPTEEALSAFSPFAL